MPLIALVELTQTAPLAVEELHQRDARNQLVEVGINAGQPDSLVTEGTALRLGEALHDVDQGRQRRVEDQR